jgi:sigma-B regulation protein RsbU (phosphoserine phosphatase)
MSIRWKFLIVVLVFSIVPLLAVITLSQIGTLRLGATISELMDNILTQSAGAELTQTTAASARMLGLKIDGIQTALARVPQLLPDRPPSSETSAALVAVPDDVYQDSMPPFILPGSLRIEEKTFPEGSTQEGAQRNAAPLIWGKPFVLPGSFDMAVSLAVAVAGGQPGHSRRVTADIALSQLLAACMLNSRWSLRMHSFLVAVDTPSPGDKPQLTVFAVRDTLENRGRWRPVDMSETAMLPGPERLRQIEERMVRGDTAFMEIPWKGQKALWAFAPASPRLVVLNVTPGMVVDVARDVLAFARWQWIDTVVASLFVILVLVAIGVWRSKAMTAWFQDMVQAVERLGHGDFASRMPLGSGDEREQVARAFNEMVPQLEDRMRIRKALDVAQEIQQTLLPSGELDIPGFAVAARSVYSDETGGDYFDFFPCGESECARYGFVVGDVTGHGIGAALLMATARAFVRAEAQKPEDLDGRISRVNRLLTADTRHSGNFMSLFFLEIDVLARRICWVRAGHDPALLFDPATGTFEELGGPGLVLGVDDAFVYRQQEKPVAQTGMILLLFTDGIWEAHDGAGNYFGKERLKAMVKDHAAASAEEIRDRILAAVKQFRGDLLMEDDMTLIVIKVL